MAMRPRRTVSSSTGATKAFGFLQVGDFAQIIGDVDEYYGMTQIYAAGSGDILTVLAEDYPVPMAEPLDPPADRTAADTYMEAFEGMLIEVPVTVTVVGPTNYFGEYYVVRGDKGVTRLVRNANPPDGYRIGVDDGLALSDDYVVGDVLDGLYGPLHYTFDNWKVEQASQPMVVSLVDVPDTLPQYPPAGDYAVTVGAFNVLNFDGLDNAVKLTKVVSSIIAMGPPTFLSLEEITVVDTWHYFDNYTVTGVIADVLGGLAAAGYNYDYAYSHADAGGHGVAVLYDIDVVQLDGVDTLQGCSAAGAAARPITIRCGRCARRRATNRSSHAGRWSSPGRWTRRCRRRRSRSSARTSSQASASAMTSSGVWSRRSWWRPTSRIWSLPGSRTWPSPAT